MSSNACYLKNGMERMPFLKAKSFFFFFFLFSWAFVMYIWGHPGYA